MSSMQTGCLTTSSTSADTRPASNSYGQILKSSVLIGGSSVFTIALGVVRTKAMAVLLGPAGVGVLGLFMSLLELSRGFAVMGLNSSGVRQIAEANTAGDANQINRTVATLRHTVMFFAAVGAVLLAALCVPVSRVTFGNANYAGGVALLAVAVFLGAISAGQIALLQGLRRIAELARANVFGALVGTVAAIAVVFFLAERGIVLSLVCVALGTLLASWWQVKKINPASTGSVADAEKNPKPALDLGRWWREASDLLKFGLVFMVVGLMTLGASYLIRIIVMNRLGEDAAGFYHAAWALGGLYVGFILQAMGADFFPRLTAAANDRPQCNRLVNEQAETSLLLAGPGILGTLTFAPLVIQIFYSSKFGPAVEILRWFCLGMWLRVASWPMGFILLAKGARGIFFWSELMICAVQMGLAWVCVANFGLKGAGIAFFLSYVVYWLQIYCIVRVVSGFRWSAENVRIGSLHAGLIALVFIAPYFSFVNIWMMYVGGSIITLLAGIHSVRKICALVPLERFPRAARRLMAFLGAKPGATP